MRSGMRVDDVVSCPATAVVDGRSFSNYDDYPASALGDITLAQAIAQSCNTALIGNADRLADGDLAAAAQALGLLAQCLGLADDDPGGRPAEQG
jgi:hypothetical protein